MALTRLDNLISSKTGKYLYVSPDDFNATDEINNRGNSPIRPFKSIQRAFLEISRFSYQPGPDNDRFDQFTVMVMPGKHYVDNRPGLATADGIDPFQFDQALNEWVDNSNLDIGDPNNCLYKFNNTEGGAIIPRGSSIIGYDLRRTSVHPLFVPDPADRLEARSAIFNVTGGCYFWQFTIRDGDLEPASPLFDNSDGIGKVYYQNGDWTAKAVPNFSHHKLTVFEYADKEELGLYYQKVAKAFSQYQPTIDDPGEFSDRIQETRIVGPLSDIRSIESIKLTDSAPAGTINVEVTSKVNHGYFKNQFVAIENNGLDEQLDGVFTISEIDLVDQRKFSYNIPGTVAALGTSTSLISGTTYTAANGLDSNAVVKAEVDSVESASPYVFNCSIRSTWGICGIWANGLKATGFKSMVIAQYTGVSLQKDDRAFIRYDEYSNTFNQASLADAFATVPYHTKGDAYWKDDWRNFHVRASEDAFIQCVSIFAVGFADHFLMESGGDMSITNSNSNFGNTSLHAIGHKGYAFAQDKGGYITDIVPPKVVDTTTGNIKKNAYYTIDIPATKNLNTASDQTKIYLGDDEGYNPETRLAASIDGFRIGARSDEKLYVKLIPRTAGSSNIFSATLSPNGFKKFNATASILNPTGITINNKDLDAADLIEANKEFIAYEAYGFITNKYPYLLDREGIDIVKCRRDIGYLLDATIQDLRLGGNINTIQAAESYYVGNNLSYITSELTETLEGYDYARDLAIASIRNFSYLRTGVETTGGSAIVDIGDTSGVVQGMTVADYDPSEFTDNKLNTGATRPASPVIPDNTYVKRVVSSTEIELGQKATFSTKKVISDRNGDARNLLLSNKLFIAAEAFDRMVLDYPSYTSPQGYGPQDCRDDLVDIVEAIAENTAYGGNDEVWDAAYHYDSGAVQYISQKKNETIRAIEYARDMSIQIMRNEQAFVFGSHGLTQTYDNTVTYEPPEVVNDRNGDARNLILANKQLIAAESVERMLIRSSTAEYTPSDAEYDPATGDLTLDIASHGLIGPTSITASDATYNPETGWLTVTSNAHGLAAGSKIKIEDDSLTLTCSMDGNASVHTYPRSTDPISDKWIEVVEADTNTFSVDVGKSLLVGHDVTAASFAPATGLLTVTIPNHQLSEGQNVRVEDSAFTFTCAQDNHATQHVYPRSTDPAYQSSVKIVADGSKHTVTGAGYNPDKGTIEFTLANHGFSDGDKIRLDDDSLIFTCAMDANATEHSYPRKSDPISGKWVTITNTTNNTFEAHVGTTGAVTYDLTNANYDPASGQLTVTVDGNHDIDVGENIRFADNALTFTCGMDGNSSNHTYPRVTDPAYATGLEVIGVGGDYDISNANYNPSTGVLEFTVPNHGISNGELIKIANESLTFTCGMDNNASEHKYPRATDPYSGDWLSVYDVAQNSFKVQIADAGSNVEFTPTNASYDPATGDLEITVGPHNLSVGDGIVMDDGALSFTCTMDGNQVAQSYPRANLDKASGRSLPITAIDTGKFTLNVGAAGSNKFLTPSGATYNENNGDMVLTVGQHGLRVGTDIVLKDNSLTFTCDKDGGATQHSYPRPGTDPFAGKSIAVTAVGSTQHTATNVDYTPSTGVMVVTVASHGFSPGDYIQVADNSITLTCDLDGNVSQKTYPRTNFDSLSNRWVPILSASTDTFTINVGSSTDNSVHTFVSASANGILKQDGTLTINVGFDADPANRYNHTFVSALTDAVEYKPQSAHTFVSALTNSIKHLPQSAHTFKRAKNYAISKRGGDITVNVGKSPIVEFTPTGANYDPNTGLMELTIGSHSLTAGTSIKLKPNSLTFTCAEDGNATQHTYPRSTDPFYDTSIEITAATATTITVQVLASQPSTNATVHTFVSATAGAVETGGDYLHTFVSATSGALISGGNYAHTFVGAVANGLTRYNDTVTLDVGTSSNTTAHTFVSAIPNAITTGGNYTHSFIDANPNGIKKANDRIRIDYGALTFTCAMDNHGSSHAYPRISDPAYQEDLPVLAASTNQITVNIGKTPQGNLDVSDAAYNPSTGDLTLTVGQHNLEPGQDVKIIGNSIKFTCNKDNNATEHAYPRPTDPAGTSSLVVKDVGSTYHSSTNASYDPATGELTLVVAGHGFTDGDRIKIADGSLTFTCDMDNNATEHAYPRLKDPSNGKWLAIYGSTTDSFKVNVGQAGASQSYTPTGVDYQPSTGNLILTIPNHNIPIGKNITIAQDSLKFRCTMGDTSEIKSYPRQTDPIYNTPTIVNSVSGDEIVINVGASPLVTHTPTGASFDPVTGLMTLIIGNHNISVGDSVKLADGAVTFTCAQDNNATNHAYPRSTIDSHNISDASYDPSTGVLTLTNSGHGIKQGDWVKVADNSLTFTCAQDNDGTNHTYPRATDPISNKWVKVLAVTIDTFDIQVLDFAPSTNTTAHTFVSAVAGAVTQKRDKSYDSPVNVTAVTADSITLDVGKSSDTTQHLFVSGLADSVTSGGNYTHTFISADYGAVVADITENKFTPTGANYDPASGDLTLTIGSHSLAVGDGITIDDNSLTFKCQMDGEQSNKVYPRPASKSLTATTGTTYNPTTGIVSITTTTEHGLLDGDFVKIADGALTFSCGFNGATGSNAEKSYPRPSDPVSGQWIKVSNVSATTFEFQCLAGLPSTNTDVHTFVSGVADAITRQTGSDWASSRSLNIVGRTSNTITVNVGGAGDNQTWTPSAADYNSTTGEMILTIGQHGLREGANIILKDNSLTFTCSKDNNTSNHSYPRPGIDPYAGEKSITINEVGATLHSAAGASYIPETGVLSLTVNNHGFSHGDYIQIVDGSLVMTCDLDGNVSSKNYPRAGFDYPSGRWLKIQNVTTNAFDVNVGISSDTTNHTFVSAVANGIKRQNGTITVNIGASPLTNYTPTAASYNASNGDLVLDIGVHDLQNGEKIRLATDSLTFTCTKDNNATNHTYPRVTDPAYNSDLEIKDATATTVTVNVNFAATADQYDHTFVSANTNAVIYNQRYTHTFVSSTTNAVHFEPQSPHTFVSAVANSIKHYPTANHTFVRAVANNIERESGTFTVNVGAAALADQYPHLFTTASAGAVQTGGAYFHKFVSAVTNSIHKVFTVAGNQQYHNQDCIDDVVDLLEAVGDNIAYGGNDKTWDAAYSYKTGAHVAGEEEETNYVFEQAREMAAQALRNQKILVTGHHGLSQVFDKSITYNEPDPPTDRFGDARNLVVANKLLIADEAYERMLVNYPGFVPPTGNPQDCKDDIVDFVEEVSYNLAYGGNDRVWEMTDLYVQGMVQEVAGEEQQTIDALNHARDLMIQIARNENIVTLGSHGRTQVRDTSITANVAAHVSNRHADAKDLILANVEFAAEIALGRMIAQYPSYTWQSGYSSTDCLDDLKDVVKVVAHNTGYGGNHRVWDAANLYVAGAHASGSENETIFAFNAVRDIIKEIATNVDVTVGGHTSLAQVKDTTITDGVSNGDCAVVLSAIDTLVSILTGTIQSPASLQGVTRTDSNGPCEDMRSAVGTLAKIVTDAIADPSTLSGKKHTVSTSSYDPATGSLTLEIGAHSYSAGTSVYIPDNSLTFTCARDNNATNHTYPRSTDPASLNDPTITGTTATSITVNVGVSSDTSVHTFVSAAEKIVVGGVTRTPSVGSCEDVRSTLNSLFKIVIDTVETPTSLDSVPRTISNGACQQVASTITTLFQIITGTINSASYLDTVERNPVPLGLEFGPSINANATSTNSYLYFEFIDGVYTTLTRTVDDTITQNTTYPQCVDQANAIRQYFSNISTVIQTGLGTVPRSEPSQLSTALSSRATVWTLGQGNVANPHDLETGTPVRLVPRPRYDTVTQSYVEVDKRFVRLPNGFNTNQEYYVIAPARTTKPENYGISATFNGTDQTKIMLASSKENAAAGIYLHSAEVEDIHPDVEIDLYQFTLDDNYDLHQYACVLDGVSNTNIRTDVPHIFDVPFSNITGHTVFFRKREGGSLPLVGAAYASDTTVADVNGRLLNNKYFYARYQTEKVFTIHKTKSDAEQGVNPITYQPGIYDFNVFANKRESPMRFDPTFVNPNTSPVIYGKWYLQVENDNSTDQIIKRLREYADGIDKTNDSWFERIKDERPADDRLYRLRYVIPQYLQSVRDPLNGFTIKTRTDETRRLVPQKLLLKPVSGNVTKARFSNPVQSNEYIGYTKEDFINFSLNEEVAYDPYKKDLVGNTQFAKTITTQNYISMTIQSGRYVTQGADDYLELTVFEQGVTNTALANTKFTTVKITAPQGGAFVANKTQSVAGNRIEWAGNSSGYGYLHAIMQVPGTTTWHMILKDTVGKIDYDSIDNIRFSQGTAFADLLADADMGKSLVLKDLIKKGYPEYYYRQNGAAVYTITPGDIIEDDASIQYYVESVEDVGQIDDTFYVFNTQEIQKRIYGQQDGIYYLTAVRGNISPMPQGAGNLGNFKNFKFSQPISKLYPLNYKNDPLWYQQLDATLVDPPQTYSAADNYVHGLVRVNDFKGSLTQESVIDLVKNNAFGTNTYTQVSASVDNRIRAQKGNAASGSEDRLIPIAGDSTVQTDQRYYVELRRPSIARAGNHTFEYLGFGPGNYSTGLPQRQEVVLTEIQDFYAQSKKQDGGLVFYTGLNSNGDLYIGNRKIDAITGEEVFLESATLQDSADDDETLGNLVTTFDTPVTFNEYITVNGGEAQDKRSTFNSPVLINVLGTVRNNPALVVSSFVDPAIDDGSLDRSAFVRNVETGGDIVIARNKISAAIFQFNSRRDGQAYKIQTHVVGAVPSNITPDQTGAFGASQIVQYGNAGAPTSGDFLLKGESIGKTGSLGWIYSNYYTLIGNAVPESFAFNNTNVITIKWVSLTNTQLGITSSSEIKITGFSDSDFNGTWQVISNGFNPASDTLQIAIGATKNSVNNQNPRMWSDEVVNNPNIRLEYSNSNWKEWGVIGAEALRTESDSIGDYKLGVNTVGRSDKASFEKNFVDAKTTPRANLDVVGTAFISGKKITDYASHATDATRTYQDRTDAFMVGGDSATPENESTFRVSTANGGRVGINVTNTELDRALVVDGESRFTGDAKFEEDIEINGGGGTNTAQVRTTITTGTIEFFPSLFEGTLDFAPLATTVHVANDSTADQFIRVGNASLHSNIWIGATPDTSTNISKIEIGGAYNNNESLSFTLIGTKSFKTKGDFQLGTDRGLLDTVKLTSTAGTVEFFSGNSATSKLDFATNAAEITIAGKGGTTTIRNNLVVDSSARFNSDITLCGGFASYSFTAYRAQIGSTAFSHASGDLGNNVFNSNVDLIDVLRVASTSDVYNAVDTAGTGDWGGTIFQNEITQISGTVEPLTLPALTGEQYYLPLKNRPFDNNGDQYISEQDILLIDTDDSGNRHPEFVKVISLPRINVAPYWIVVERLPFGTYTAKRSDHPDTTAIYKCVVQYNATWTTTTIDATGAEENVYLAQFGGSIELGDYVIIDREDTTNNGIFDQGEMFKVKVLLSQVAKKLSIKNGCDTANEVTVFEVDSTTGNTQLGTGGTTVINGQLSLNGTCASPYTNDPTNKKLTITNGSEITTFEVDTCTGDTTIGNHHGTVFMLAEQYGTAPAAYTKGVDEVHVYRHNPMSVISGGPATTTADNVVTATSNIEIQGNLTSFTKGDLVAIYTTDAIEIIQITDDPYTGSGGELLLPTSSNAQYTNGGRGMEGTSARAFSIGANVVKLDKYDRTTTLLHDVPALQADRATELKARTPNQSDIRLEISLKDADLIAPKLDYVTLVRIGSEFFLPDSVDGTLDAFYAIKMPKQIREPNVVGTTPVQLFGGGSTTINQDLEIMSGVLRMYGSDGKTLVMSIANDDGHSGDGSLEDPKTDTAGLTLKGAAAFYGDLKIYYDNCQMHGVCSTETSFRVTNREGNILMGETFYQKGKVLSVESAIDPIFHIDNLGAAGTGGTEGPKDFKIYQNNAIDSFGIEKYWTAGGGRRHTYVAFDPTTGLGQQIDNPLQVNQNYLVNASSGSNMVVYLPDNAQTGDMIRFVELSGNLTYNTSLIIRAKKINNISTNIQGDGSGSRIAAGAGQTLNTAWDSGELIIQTRNASFGLVYAGTVDVEGSASAQTIPPGLRGWWLIEL